MEVNRDVGDGPLSARELGQGRESPPGRAARATPAPPNTAVPSGPEPTNRRPTDSSGSPGGSISTGLFQADRQWEARVEKAPRIAATFLRAQPGTAWHLRLGAPSEPLCMLAVACCCFDPYLRSLFLMQRGHEFWP